MTGYRTMKVQSMLICYKYLHYKNFDRFSVCDKEMDRLKLATPFCGTGDRRSVAIIAGCIYLVGVIYSVLDYAAVQAQIVTRTRAFVGQCMLQ